mmetsp:Transcript_17385/g.26377  ORF Transcript_17385/g.26377 Transcript_17385/m.26377 type:complete len:569 (-) Transcript_17385:485-2191(-)
MPSSSLFTRVTVSLLIWAPILRVVNAATCGDGSIGDGICSNPSLCCSEWGYCDDTEEHCSHEPNCGSGWIGNGRCDDPNNCCSIDGYCGTTAKHCGGSSLTPLPDIETSSSSSSTTTNREDHDASSSRLIAFLGNWQACPTRAQLASYTHIVVSFAVSYMWSPDKNICSQTCEIAEPAICNNQINTKYLKEWQSNGKKVLLSFGGAGMGGSWEGNDGNDCWEYCYGRETQVANRLVELVQSMGFDGIDLDFEYYVTPKAVAFLTQVTKELREKLPSGAELSHVPMDSDIIPGKPYYEEILKEVGPLLDFLMPQYYNGVARPALDGLEGQRFGAMATLDHYDHLVQDIMDGDATRVIFGFCLQDCGPTNSNVNAGQASIILKDLSHRYPCHGGAFFWVVKHDVSGRWSMAVKSTLDRIAANNACHLTTEFLSSLGALLEQALEESPPPTSSPKQIVLPAPPIPATLPPGFAGFWESFTSLFQEEEDEEEPTKAPAPAVCCPTKYTGLRAYQDCTQYYHCVDGIVAGPLLKVPSGTLFDEKTQNFNFANLVICPSSTSCGGTRNLRYIIS